VPEEWRAAWAASGGNPALMMSAPNLQRTLQASTLVQPIAQQPQTQPVIVREPGVTRGGSFSLGDGFTPSHPEAPIAPTFTAPIQSAISREVAYTPDLFDWNRFVQYPDRFPHACVVGASGDGKTSTQEYIARLIGGGNELIILSTKRKSDQWVGLTPIGLGRNFAPIAHQWGEISKELDRRCLDLDHAQTQHQVIVAIDELNDIIGNTTINLANIARAGREPRIRLIVNSHTAGVEGLGLKGNNEIKSCFTWVRLGDFALQHAQQLLNKGFLNQSDLEWLRGQQWPCMVDDVLAQVPDLSLGWQSRLGGSTTTTITTASNLIEPQSPYSLKATTPPGFDASNQPGSMVGSTLNALPPAIEPPQDEPTDIETKFSTFKDLGMTKAQIIYALWGCKKGNSSRYMMASEFYDRLNSSYSQISGESAA
jgi:hypothetical protein